MLLVVAIVLIVLMLEVAGVASGAAEDEQTQNQGRARNNKELFAECRCTYASIRKFSVELGEIKGEQSS